MVDEYLCQKDNENAMEAKNLFLKQEKVCIQGALMSKF